MKNFIYTINLLTMKKTYQEKELAFDTIVKVGDSGFDVKRVQEWLNLWRYVDTDWNNVITIDGKYGNQSKQVVIQFQRTHGLHGDGEVGPATWTVLSEPMKKAYRLADPENLSIRDLIQLYALQHLKNIPRELNHNNEGPWVRAYMDGNEGAPWAWCMGFAQSIIDQAFSTIGLDFKKVMPHVYSCDIVGEKGLDNGRLMRNAEIMDLSQIQVGDVFLNVRTPHDWVHTGIIVGVEGDWIHTVEGNTNDEGVREGFEVCSRMRNMKTNNIDIYNVSP